MLLVNWHNASFHAHGEPAGADLRAVHDHDHLHHSDHHHHDLPNMSLLDWLQQLLSDFEHADLGGDHFQVFLHPQHQTGADQAVVTQPITWTVLSSPMIFRTGQAVEENEIPDRLRSFSDPPFLDIVANRGPPLFS